MAMLDLCFTILLPTSLLIITLIILQKSNKKSSKLPPGRVGWPIIGESVEFMSSPSKFMHDRMIQHSPNIFRSSIGGQKMAILCGASGNKFFYSNESKLTYWLPNTIAKPLSIVLSQNNTRTWKLFEETFYKMIKLDSLKSYVSKIDLKAREHIDMFWVPYKEVKVQERAKDYTFALSCYLFMGCGDLEQVKELADPYYKLVKGLISVPLNIPGTTYNRSMKASKVLLQRLEGIVRRRMLRGTEKSEEGDMEGKDLLSTLVKGLSESGESLDEKILASRFLALLFVSFHTTSNAITFSLHYLAQHPHVYAKVVHENLEIIKSKAKGEALTWKDIQKMKYSWNVVCESMRLIPPALGGFREVIIDDFSYDGLLIPKGWQVHWSPFSTNKDPKYFPDPEKFDPSRFESNLAPGAFVPFGGGPHMCCGKELARLETLAYLHNVITKFKLQKPNPNEKIIYTPDPVSVDGLRMCIQPHTRI